MLKLNQRQVYLIINSVFIFYKIGWDHRKKEDKVYDPWCRNPSYAGSDSSISWEYASLSRHYHPSLRKFANNIATDSKEVSLHSPLI